MTDNMGYMVLISSLKHEFAKTKQNPSGFKIVTWEEWDAKGVKSIL